MITVHRTAALALGRTRPSLWALTTLFLGCNGGTPAAGSQPQAEVAEVGEVLPDDPAATPAPTPTAGNSQITPAREVSAPAHGYGDKIAWRGLDEGLAEAKTLGRPLMLLVHAPWCGRCSDLKPRFFDPALVQASERFVMVNLDQDDEPQALRYGPDGQYVPRVLFLDPQGKVDATLSNAARSQYKYFYLPQDDLVGVMQQALDHHASR
ncbi:MAG: thioredoxin family protein [Nannocystis sp.]|nr:thioredoxin family protein [Nannocystis sp.]MBA3547550.1 thioredoxin family protein [Nannocystis sp.]